MKRPGLQVRMLQDGCAVLDGDAEVVHVLNPSAAFVFLHCDGRHSRSEIASLLAEAVPALDAERAARDVDDGLRTLRDKQLLQ